MLKTEAQRLSRLVRLMLELGRLETSAGLERRPVDLMAVAEQAVVAARAPGRAARDHLLPASQHARAAGGRRSGSVDAGLPQLLDNVIKHCRPGDGAVVSLERTEEGVVCTVRDTGPGVPAVHLPHITRRFYRAAPQKVEGSGLGLALVEEILRRHGSELTIESQAEGEARRLPACASSCPSCRSKCDVMELFEMKRDSGLKFSPLISPPTNE